jgi:hypothetical protein
MQDLFYQIIRDIDLKDVAVGAIITIGILLVLVLEAAAPDDWS